MPDRPRSQAASADVVLKGARLPSSPWIYRNRIQRPSHPPSGGSYVGLRDEQGRLLARGFYNRRSEITFRVLGGSGASSSLQNLLRQRLRMAMSLRTDVLELPRQTDAFRIVHGEGDGLSGLVIDRYAETCVVSLYAAGWMKAAEILEVEIQKLDGIDRVLFRADARTQKLEGFRIPDISPGERTRIREGKLRYEVDLATGHKTGLFLDQRDNRKRVASFARGRRVLDLCTNAGGFALSCRGPGKARHVTAVDLDEDAVVAARKNARLNNLRIAFQHADLFPFLRERVEAGDQWDLIVLDPPKLAHGKGEIDAALTRYQDMNRLALSAAAPGAIMLTCSCSGAVEESAFLGAVRRAAVDAQRSVRVIELRGASSDHPVALDFSEGRYLKGALLHVD